MKNHRGFLVFIFAILALTLVACGQKSNPADVYWQYQKACSDGNFLEAEKFLEESARDRARTLGVCGFTHDAINTSEIANGRPERTFSTDPEANVDDNSASITWYDDQGNIATVLLIEINGEWKVTEAIWSR